MRVKQPSNKRRQRAVLLVAGLMPVAVWAGPRLPERGLESVPVVTLADVLPSELVLLTGKSFSRTLPVDIARLSVGDAQVADVVMLGPRELYVLGKRVGTTNLIIWPKKGAAQTLNLRVDLDLGGLRTQLQRQFPDEHDLDVSSLGRSVVLHGHLANALQVSQAVALAEAFVEAHSNDRTAGSPEDAKDSQGGTPAMLTKQQVSRRVLNLLKLRDPQQVMLEVKVAEVAKSVLDRMGFNWLTSSTSAGGGVTRSYSGLFGAGPFAWNRVINQTTKIGPDPTTGAPTVLATNTSLDPDRSSFGIDAEQRDGLIKILAEPTLLALSGQEASFLAGGKIFIPVARRNDATGGVSLTLEEKEYGVGIRFTPTVLESGRIHLKVAPEVSELVTTGSPFVSADGQISILPSLTTRKASTAVQLRNGESFAIAGLVKNNSSGTISAFPGLGDLPILGPLFRSTDYRNDKTELLFVITPRLVQPVTERLPLPTDGLADPKRGEVLGSGKLEAVPPAEGTAPMVTP